VDLEVLRELFETSLAANRAQHPESPVPA
jgi:hypothetical protein